VTMQIIWSHNLMYTRQMFSFVSWLGHKFLLLLISIVWVFNNLKLLKEGMCTITTFQLTIWDISNFKLILYSTIAKKRIIGIYIYKSWDVVVVAMKLSIWMCCKNILQDGQYHFLNKIHRESQIQIVNKK